MHTSSEKNPPRGSDSRFVVRFRNCGPDESVVHLVRQVAERGLPGVHRLAVTIEQLAAGHHVKVVIDGARRSSNVAVAFHVALVPALMKALTLASAGGSLVAGMAPH